MTDEKTPPSTEDAPAAHRSHAYVRRRGRLTQAQSRGLDALENYRIEPEEISASAAWQGMEIGFGMGHGLLDWAQQRPAASLLGVELYEPGVGAVVHNLQRLELQKLGLAHVRILVQPAQEVVAAMPDACLDEVRILFPDPWPKKRHHKRRLIQAPFIEALARVMRPQARLWLATDWAPYAVWMREVMDLAADFELSGDDVRASDEVPQDATQALGPLSRVTTRFEQRGTRLGHAITDLVYTRR